VEPERLVESGGLGRFGRAERHGGCLVDELGLRKAAVGKV